MNILDKKNMALAPTFGGLHAPVPKREKFSWVEPCSPGTFMQIPKDDLNIDGEYQREQVSKLKVMEIARDWDWKLFGTVSVIRREDGTLWVYEGGHRTRASFFRDDIDKIPCMVFNVSDKKIEAKAFIGANTMKSAVSAFHKHRAAVITDEPIAIAVQSILEKNGYFPTQTITRPYGFAAISSLRRQVEIDRVLAEKVFSACSSIAQNGEAISGAVLDAIFFCQKKLEGKADILTNGYLDKLAKETIPGIEAAIRREKHIIGKGGFVISAKAILDLLNKGKQRRLAFN